MWLVIAATIFVIGAAGATLSGESVARSDVLQARRSSDTSSIQIASRLELAVQHEQDLAVSIGGLIIQDPNASNSRFARWVGDVRAFQRYPEVDAIARLAFVRADRLQAFGRQLRAGSTDSRTSQAPYAVVSDGKRPYYCLVAAEKARPQLATFPFGLDLCSTSLRSELLESRDSGRSLYAPDSLGGRTVLNIVTPVYQGGVVPRTVEGRRSAFLGWTGIQVVPSQVLAIAQRGRRNTAVSFRYKTGAYIATFNAGTRPSRANATAISLHNGWTVWVFTAAINSGLLANSNALALFSGILLLSLILALFIYALGTSRSRSVDLVRERTDQLQHQALHDSLTGLPNRALILDRIGQMLVRGRRQRSNVAALFVDLDNFKDVNDTLGHRVGDELLVHVGIRLSSAIRESDSVGRLGGDEFVILAEGASLDAGTQVVADRILDVLSTPFDITGSDGPLIVSASIGIAEGDRSTPEELLQDADIALYQAKAAGKRCAVRFAPSMQEAMEYHRHLEVDLQNAMEAQEFFLMYQPTIDLNTDRFTGVEALLRWRHPLRGVVQPNDFIPALEATGLILPVGAWVLHEACRQAADWASAGYDFAMSVNVSGRQLEVDRLVDDVRFALSDSGFDPTRLILELTETTLMHDAEASVTRLRALKDIGIRIAVDDFGTGYSSLAYLRQFPIDVLKIDRTFIAGIGDSEESDALVHTLIQLGKVLGLETVAEGVETSDQRSRLKTANVDVGQGFLFARPLASADAEKFFRSLGDDARADAKSRD
jgi:diguanylate cyclase (GGDEF)-like protein